MHVWKQLISDDQDAEYLLEGIEHGFILQDSNAPTTPPPRTLTPRIIALQDQKNSTHLLKKLSEQVYGTAYFLAWINLPPPRVLLVRYQKAQVEYESFMT